MAKSPKSPDKPVNTVKKISEYTSSIKEIIAVATAFVGLILGLGGKEIGNIFSGGFNLLEFCVAILSIVIAMIFSHVIINTYLSAQFDDRDINYFRMYKKYAPGVSSVIAGLLTVFFIEGQDNLAIVIRNGIYTGLGVGLFMSIIDFVVIYFILPGLKKIVRYSVEVEKNTAWGRVFIKWDLEKWDLGEWNLGKWKVVIGIWILSSVITLLIIIFTGIEDFLRPIVKYVLSDPLEKAKMAGTFISGYFNGENAGIYEEDFPWHVLTLIIILCLTAATIFIIHQKLIRFYGFKSKEYSKSQVKPKRTSKNKK